MNPIAKDLKQLLNDLDQVAEVHGEVGDTEVRERMGDVLLAAFFKPAGDARVPEELGMFSPEGNRAVAQALVRFLHAVKPKIGSEGLATPQERLNAFQDEEIESAQGMYYDDYFGYWEKLP